MGQCLKISEGTFCLKMADSNAIFGSTLSILMLEQFFQRKKMRLERAHLMQPSTKRFELFFRNYSSSKDDQLQILQMVIL